MYPKAYIDYLVYFHSNRDYFECHEVLEEYWKEAPIGKRDITWVGLIQIAVSLYHQRRNNFNGASRMMKNAIHILTNQQNELSTLGIDADTLIQLLEKKYIDLTNKQPYESFNFPITDQNLLQICEERCKKIGFAWGKPSDFSNDFIINKHRKRDRSDVIAERLASINKKKSQQD